MIFMQNLEKMLLEGVEKNTPESVKNDKVFDYTNKDKFTFTLTRNLVEKLDLKKWFEGYKKEAMVSTAGIRGPQNIIYPHDTRFPINTIGITLATLAKALVLKEKYPNNEHMSFANALFINNHLPDDIIKQSYKAGVRIVRHFFEIFFFHYRLALPGIYYLRQGNAKGIKIGLYPPRTPSVPGPEGCPVSFWPDDKTWTGDFGNFFGHSATDQCFFAQCHIVGRIIINLVYNSSCYNLIP